MPHDRLNTRPECIGKMGFYVTAVDELPWHPHDQPTIGIVLCKSKNKTVAEYALRSVSTPIAVAIHSLLGQIKDNLPTDNLPTVEQLEMELDAVGNEPSEQSHVLPNN